MMLKETLFLTFIFVGSIFGDLTERPSSLPCKLNDAQCINALAQWMYSSVMPENPEKGIASSDPMYQKKIKGNLGYVNYTLEKTTIDGFKNCKVSNSSIHSESTSMHVDLLCPRIHMVGDYDINGKLLTFPIRGKGGYYADFTNYYISIDTNADFYKQGKDLHAKFETFTVKADLLGGIDFKLENLLDGDKKLSDDIYRLGKENPRLFVSLADGPLFNSNIKKIMKSFNIVLKETPITDFLQVDESNVKL